MDASGRRSLERENECADVLADRGYHVHQNPSRREVAEARAQTGDRGNPGKDPDYLVEGHVFDCYAPGETKSVRGVWSGVRDKVEDGQTERVVLNLGDWRGDLDALRKQFDDWPVDNLKELVALTPTGKLVKIVAHPDAKG
ncbi:MULTISPECIES: CdiA C-terminal domain-containing protein [Plantactinospora]|uniref:tRNA nuclease CdiA C-terminal domain-containing protein n=1 Tax=Plantactinospora sonchi TaxID=1544735 RepID=A0ABU7RUJ7_9ACTN